MGIEVGSERRSLRNGSSVVDSLQERSGADEIHSCDQRRGDEIGNTMHQGNIKHAQINELYIPCASRHNLAHEISGRHDINNVTSHQEPRTKT